MFGEDIRIMPYFSAHDTSNLDFVTTDKLAAGPTKAELTDIATLGGRENLAQALTLRLLIPRGSLAGLGHSQYGSRLHEIIGRPKTETLRNLCRVFVLETVAQEPRVEDKAVALTFDLLRETPSSFYFDLVVKPKEDPNMGSEPLSISLEVGL